jgi:hypothetical protein
MNVPASYALRLLVVLFASVTVAAETPAGPEAVTPTEPIELFNGRDFSGLYTFLKGRGVVEEPDEVFCIEDGAIRVTGEGRGYIGTRKAYRDYHLRVDFKWGKRTDGSGYVRNAGVLVHATGADGAHRSGAWMPSLEIQLAQGCEGDLIVIRGKDAEGNTIPIDMASQVRRAEDGRTRWQPGGEKVRYSGRQFWWSKHQPFFKEKLDTRGRDDVASPLGEWTRVDVLCAGDRVTVKINGKTVNEAIDVWPTCGRILLQNEGNEIYYRNWELRPVQK